MRTTAPPPSSEPPSRAACIAGLRTALADARAAVEAWRDERQDPMTRLLDDAASALLRANRMASALTKETPAHSRRARVVLHAVEQVTHAIQVVDRAREWDWSKEDQAELDVMNVKMDRALGTAARALDTAESKQLSGPRNASSGTSSQ